MGLFDFLIGNKKLTLKDIDNFSRDLDMVTGSVYLPKDANDARNSKDWKLVPCAVKVAQFSLLAKSKFLQPLNEILEENSSNFGTRFTTNRKKISNKPLIDLIINWKKYEKFIPHKLIIDVQDFLVNDRKEIEIVVSEFIKVQPDLNVCTGHLQTQLGQNDEGKIIFESSQRLSKESIDFLNKQKAFVKELIKRRRTSLHEEDI